MFYCSVENQVKDFELLPANRMQTLQHQSGIEYLIEF